MIALAGSLRVTISPDSRSISIKHWITTGELPLARSDRDMVLSKLSNNVSTVAISIGSLAQSTVAPSVTWTPLAYHVMEADWPVPDGIGVLQINVSELPTSATVVPEVESRSTTAAIFM